jgi:hypothetical protein
MSHVASLNIQQKDATKYALDWNTLNFQIEIETLLTTKKAPPDKKVPSLINYNKPENQQDKV